MPALVQRCALELHFADSSAHWTFACLSISHRTASSSTRQSVRLSTSIRNFSKGSSDAWGDSSCRQWQQGIHRITIGVYLRIHLFKLVFFAQRCVVCQTARSHTTCIASLRSLPSRLALNQKSGARFILQTLILLYILNIKHKTCFKTY